MKSKNVKSNYRSSQAKKFGGEPSFGLKSMSDEPKSQSVLEMATTNFKNKAVRQANQNEPINNSKSCGQTRQNSNSSADVFSSQTSSQSKQDGNLELSEPQTSNNSQDSTHCCDKVYKVMTHILNTVLILKKDVQNILLIQETRNPSTIHETNIHQCNTYDELKEFDNSLQDDDFFKKCCMRLSLYGGKDAPEATRLILSQIIGQELATSMNFIGKNNKDGLISLKKIMQVLTESVRRNPTFASTTDTKIHQASMIWLRNASDRGGGRTRRKNN